ncbi:MAG: sugar phosphate isomerase/epimerase family protein [Bacteroidota bacterium]
MKINCCWLYAISKYGYPPSVEDALNAFRDMARLGFRHVELEGVGEENLTAVYERRHEFKSLADDLGLRVVNFCPILSDLVSPEAKKRRKALDLFKLGVETAAFLGCETVQTDSYTPPFSFIGEAPYKEMINYGLEMRVRVPDGFSWQNTWDILVDAMARCADLSADAGLRFCLEPRVGELISNTDAMLRLLAAVDSPWFGAVLDTAHQHAGKEILPLSVEKLGARIFYLHVADNNSQINEHLALGRGTIDWDSVFTALKRYRFDGFVAIDVGRVPDLDEQILESLRFLRGIEDKYCL